MRPNLCLLRGLLALAAVPAGPALAASTPSGIPGYVTDSRGIVVRSSAGDCWHTSGWTPSMATVIGCDGVLSKAMPVPAPSRAEPPAKPAPDTTRVAPQADSPAPAPTPAMPTPTPAPTPQAAPTAPAQPAPPASAAPVVPAVPSAPSAPQAGLGPDGDAGAAQREPRSEKVTLDTDTYFDFDKATLKPEGRRKLDELASRLAGMRLEVVVATGHTDAIGSRQYNQGLSVRRAQAVRAFLQEKGLPVDKIFTTGKGESQPAASNQTREGRAQNRRVEVEVVGIRERQ